MSISIGKKVKVHYTGKHTDGRVFDTSENSEPLEFIVGKGMVIKGFEDGVVSMSKGERKIFTVTPSEAYGEINKELITTIGISKLPKDVKVGDRVRADNNGTVIHITIMGFDKDMAIIHADHPLAGQTLIYDVELLEIM